MTSLAPLHKGTWCCVIPKLVDVIDRILILSDVLFATEHGICPPIHQSLLSSATIPY